MEPQTDEELEAEILDLRERLETAKRGIGHPIPPNAGDDPRYSEVMAAFMELRRVSTQLAFRRRNRATIERANSARQHHRKESGLEK